jgi:putative tRNA adenosine deaminase-associated protein
MAEIDLGGAADLEEIADRLRDVDQQAEVSLLFVEADDTYLAILRLDNGEDLRIFASDSAFAEESRVGALLLGYVEAPALEIDAVVAPAGDDAGSSEPSHPIGDPDADPVGDADLLADLGISGHSLITLCGQEGMLPSDVTAELCGVIGCGDEVEELRV